MQRILAPTKFPVARVPVYSGSASGEIYGMKHDPGHGKLYFAPFAVATEPGLPGEPLLKERGTKTLIHPRPEGMKLSEWGDGLVDLVEGNLPEGYNIQETLVLLTGCNLIVKGKKVKEKLGSRIMNVHPAPLYILSHPQTGEIVDAWGLDPTTVRERYLDKGFVRRYVGWGEDIMPKIVAERRVSGSTLHIATPKTDHGPNIAYREKVREPRHFDNPKLYQKELKDEGDGPVIIVGTRMIIKGLSRDGNTLYWREELPYQGYEVPEGWETLLHRFQD